MNYKCTSYNGYTVNKCTMYKCTSYYGFDTCTRDVITNSNMSLVLLSIEVLTLFTGISKL